MSRNAQLRVFIPGGSTASTDVDLTLGISDLGTYPTINSPAAFPLEGRTESRPWSVNVVDVGSTFSANLSDSTGRMDILGRLADFQIDDGAGMVTKGTGRISDVFLTQEVGAYEVFVSDERMLERRQTIFQTSTTTQVFPPGLGNRWLGFSTAQTANGEVFAIAGVTDSAITRIGLSIENPGAGLSALTVPNMRMPQSIIADILEDMIDNPISGEASDCNTQKPGKAPSSE